jgi:hypothetical protein
VTVHGTWFKRGIHAELNYRRWLARPRVFLNTSRKDRIKGNLQRYAHVPFYDSLIYLYSFVACLEFSTVNLYRYMEASGDPSEAKSEISCVNGLGEINTC